MFSSVRPRRFGSKHLWTNRAERLQWVTRPKKKCGITAFQGMGSVGEMFLTLPETKRLPPENGWLED